MRLLENISRVIPFTLKSTARREMEFIEAREAFVQRVLRERLSELEFDLEEWGYTSADSTSKREFTRSGLAKIMQLSRFLFLKNPLVNRAVVLQSIYVWGQGVTVTCKESEEVQAFINEFMKRGKNEDELFSHQARTMKEQDLQVVGNLFFVFFSDISDGETNVRTIPAEEIQEVICNPDDAKEPWYYLRQWTADRFDPKNGKTTGETRRAYYPDFRYEPEEGLPDTIAGVPVMKDPVYHVRVGGLSDMRFGVPETYQAQDWARVYTKFCEDWCSVISALAQFAFTVDTKGGVVGQKAVKAKLNSTLMDGTNQGLETNPRAAAGSYFLQTENQKLNPIKTSGMTTSMDDGRRLLLMVAASFGMPESFFGDVSVGNLATAKSLDRPTELKFRDRQELWGMIYRTIIGYAFMRSRRAANGKMRMDSIPERPNIETLFPPILEHDIKEQLTAIALGATLDGKPEAGTMTKEQTSRLVMQALGVQNIDDVIEELKGQWEEDAQADADRTAALIKAASSAAKAPAGPVVDPAVKESIKKLAGVIERFHESLTRAA